MPTFPLTARYSERAADAASAWLTPGDDPAEWLAEWSRWGLPLEECRWLWLPGHGALLLPPAGAAPAGHPRAAPWRRLGARVLAPAHAELAPAASESELAALIPADRWLVFLPPNGQARLLFDHDARPVACLLAPPPRRAADWGRARPGEALNQRLWSVEPHAPPTLRDVLAAGRGDIGARGGALDQLPPRPDEPSASPAANLLRSAALRGLRALQGLLGGANASQKVGAAGAGQHGGAGAPGDNSWLHALRAWTSRQLEAWRNSIQEARERELRRLEHLLETDPDEGLKFALPLRGDDLLGGDAPRGLAPPSTRLGPRAVDYSATSGGGPADRWFVNVQRQALLATRYRDLANRELRLGRHRRAAYIFAELLGDFGSAAAALRAGEHWREAAALYGERLQQPALEAECLEKGGFLAEAAPIFERLGQHEKAGDVWARLEQWDEARAAWRRAARRHEDQQNHLAAAKLTEEKLADQAETLAILRRAWPHAGQARACQTRVFELLGRAGRHAEAAAAVRQLRTERWTRAAAVLATETLADAAAAYPDAACAELAADGARVVAARHLAAANEAEQERLVAALRKLAPGDKLLTRDGDRFLTEQRVARARSAPKPERPGVPSSEFTDVHAARHRAGYGPTVERRFQLPGDLDIRCWAALSSGLLALGLRGSLVEMLLVDWRGVVQRSRDVGCRDALAFAESARLIVDPAGRQRPRVLAPRDFKCAGDSWRFHDPDGGGRPMVVELLSPGIVGAPTPVAAAWFGDELAIACRAPDRDETQVGLWSIGLDGSSLNLRSTTRMGGVAETASPPADMPMLGRAEWLALGLGDRLAFLRRGGEVSTVELEEPVLALAGSPPGTLPRLVASLATGAVLVAAAAGAAPRLERLPSGLLAPRVCFLPAGRLVVEGDGFLELHSLAPRLAFARRLRLERRPLALLGADAPDRFALVYATWEVEVWKAR